MARKVRNSDWKPGLYVHYWGENWQVWSVGTKEVVLVVPGKRPGKWYKPCNTDLTKPTSIVVCIDNEFLMILDDGRHKSEEDTNDKKDSYKQYEKDAKEDVARGWGRKAGS